MTIVHVTWTLGVGGAEEMLVDIVNEQCRTEQVWIIAVNSIVEVQLRARVNPAVHLVFLGRTPGSWSPVPILRLNWLLARLRPDVVHVHTWTLVKLLPVYYQRNIVLTVHTTKDAEEFDQSINRYSAIFAISEAVAEAVQQRVRQSRPIVITNGIQAAEIAYITRKCRESFRVLQIARLEHACKGQDLLLRAFANLMKDTAERELTLDFVGGGESRQLLEDMVRDLHLEKHVTFRGAIPRSVLYKEICNYDLVVQASRYEGFGLAVVEAMVAGVPVLVSDLEGPRRVIDDGRLGFLFRSDDDVDCARAIEEIRRMTRERSADLNRRVQSAREYACEEFDVKRTAGEYVDAYRDVVGIADIPGRKSSSEPTSIVTSREV